MKPSGFLAAFWAVWKESAGPTGCIAVLIAELRLSLFVCIAFDHCACILLFLSNNHAAKGSVGSDSQYHILNSIGMN